LALGKDGWAKTARRTFDRLDCGVNSCDYLVDGSCSRRRRQEKPCRTSRKFSGRISFYEKPPTEHCLCQRGGIPLPRLIRTLVVLVVLAAEQVLPRSCSQRLAALASKLWQFFSCPSTKTSDFAQSTTWFWVRWPWIGGYCSPIEQLLVLGTHSSCSC
jgi:hypothetical protein